MEDEFRKNAPKIMEANLEEMRLGNVIQGLDAEMKAETMRKAREGIAQQKIFSKLQQGEDPLQRYSRLQAEGKATQSDAMAVNDWLDLLGQANVPVQKSMPVTDIITGWEGPMRPGDKSVPLETTIGFAEMKTTQLRDTTVGEAIQGVDKKYRNQLTGWLDLPATEKNYKDAMDAIKDAEKGASQDWRLLNKPRNSNSLWNIIKSTQRGMAQDLVAMANTLPGPNYNQTIAAHIAAFKLKSRDLVDLYPEVGREEPNIPDLPDNYAFMSKKEQQSVLADIAKALGISTKDDVAAPPETPDPKSPGNEPRTPPPTVSGEPNPGEQKPVELKPRPGEAAVDYMRRAKQVSPATYKELCRKHYPKVKWVD